MNQAPRRQLYAPILTQVRRVMISRMAKPEEVLVVENEQGEVVREFMKVRMDGLSRHRLHLAILPTDQSNDQS